MSTNRAALIGVRLFVYFVTRSHWNTLFFHIYSVGMRVEGLALSYLQTVERVVELMCVCFFFFFFFHFLITIFITQ
jgi:hypothetical protein